MTDRPPSPSTPTTGPATADTTLEGDIVATTAQLTDAIEDALGCRLDDSVFEDLLLELDRRDYVDWVTITRRGDYVWDLSDSPDRIGEAIAEAVVDRLESWLANAD
ncbi:hypothetical protein [Natrinema sp. 1APR25-10V2]|uniref:hypothetical protein n=1 Tax=Natrinema sp. 1APR25-10V2 TaxID=2951081 RepID=UPI002875911F|nr:hypothetical protein [Natrinema sp. 1APR25-10V2]MDS0474069.1 hypothetical protein [Natrinema sp. 1APR25-10V2]